MIIGITGTDGAGKGAAVTYLVQEKGFVHYSARSFFIDEIKKRGLSLEKRNDLRLMANTLRKEHGNDYVVREALTRIKNDGTKHAVIESIRALAEAETLKNAGGILLAVDADQVLRYKRVQARRSESDKVSFLQFKEQEDLEMNDPDPHGMQKQKVIEMADCIIYNNDSFVELHAQIESFLKKIDRI